MENDPFAAFVAPKHPIDDFLTPDPFDAFLAPKTQEVVDQQPPLQGPADERSLVARQAPADLTPAQIRNLSVRDLMEYRDELNRYTQIRKSSGLLKGTASGLTLGLSEQIPNFAPDEQDVGFQAGELAGSAYPIGKLYNYLGKPLVTLAAKSPIAKQGLKALARMTGFGLTGATYEGSKDLLKGEVPTAEELGKQAVTWAAIDAGLQVLGLGLSFSTAIRNIAEKEGVSSKEVLSRLWQSTKNYFESLTGKAPNVVGEQEIEILAKQAEKAEAEGLSSLEKTIVEVEPVEAKPIDEKPAAIETPLSVNEPTSTKPIKAEYQPTLDLGLPGKNPINPPALKAENEDILKQKTIKELPKEPIESQPVNVGEDLYKADQKKHKPVPPETNERPRNPYGKKQAVARSLILKKFRVAFRDPIRLGNLGHRKALGVHIGWNRVTRLLKDNDIETAAHEIGHNLHTVLYGGQANTPEELNRNIIKALKPYLDELKPLAHYEPFTKEGFAEFTRLYVTNPNAAKKLAPKFYEKFENDLIASYPEMRNALLEARDYYEQYLEGTPQSRIRAQTSYLEDSGKLQKLKALKGKKFIFDKLITNYVDDLFPAKRVVSEAFGIPISEVENLKDPRNLYRSLRVLKGAVGKADVFIEHETFNAKTLEKTGPGLKSILNKLEREEDYRDFNDYLIARRALEKHSQRIETGVNALDARLTYDDLHPKYAKLATELDRYLDSVLQYARDCDLISAAQYMLIKKKNIFYVPFARDIERSNSNVRVGAGKIQASKPNSLKRMKGSSSDIIPPLEAILKNTYNIIINAEKNLSGKTLAQLATKQNMGAYIEKLPKPTKVTDKLEADLVAKELAKSFERHGFHDLVELDANGKIQLRHDLRNALPDLFMRFGVGKPVGNNIITVFYGNEPVYYELSPDLYEMWNHSLAPYTADLLTKILRIPARTLRAGAILNPKFVQKNFIRDTWGSWLFTKYGKSIKDPSALLIDTLYSPLAMMSVAARKSPLYIEWLKAGGGMSTMQSLDRESVVKKLDEVRHGYKPTQVIKWLRLAAEISEEANRLNEFVKALEMEGNTRLGKEIAAFAGRDLSVDFSKMGLQTKALNQIIPFFNATIQGGDKLLRALNNPKDRAQFIPRILGFIVLPSLMLYWANKDDDRLKEFYPEELDFNFMTFVGNQAIKIPVPFETGVIAHGLTQRLLDYFLKKDPEAFEGFMGSIQSAMLPSFIPALASPLIETYANKNFFTGGSIVPKNREDLISKYQYTKATSSTARLLGRAMAYMLGQDTRSKAASPAIIDHFINSWFGGLGRLMINISDASLEAAGLVDKIPGPERSIVEKSGFDAFTSHYPRANTQSIEKFYQNFQDATSRQKSIKHAEANDLETEKELDKAYTRFDKIYDYASLKEAYNAIQSNQREINNIYNDPSIDSKLKSQMIDDLYLQQIEFAKAVNEDIKKYRLSQEK